jgi:hypothetical protein
MRNWPQCVSRSMSVSMILIVPSLGCSQAGGAGEAVRPKARTAADAMGVTACGGVNGRALTPLVVDLSGADRLDFEAQMRSGVAIVQATCDGMRILPGCTVAGEYSFVGVTAKEESMQLKSGDELAANIPFSAGKVGGSLNRDQSLDLAMLMIGKRTTPLGAIYREELVGACEGATHSVRAATIGAFAMETATLGKVQAAATMFGVGASGASSSAENKGHRDGDPAACKTADPNSPNPPAQCSALLRLELMPIQPGKAPDRAKPPAPEAQPVVATCPAGFLMQAGKCTQDVGGGPHVCNPANFDDCASQCDAGNADSCYNAASASQFVGLGNRYDELMKKACDGGSVPGCFGLAQSLEQSNPAHAIELFRKGCADGHGPSCMELGGGGVQVSVDDQVGALKRACLLGEGLACQTAAGYLMKTNVPAAQDMLEQSGMASNVDSCVSGATLYFGDKVGGVAGEKNEVKALKLAVRGCRLHSPGLCLAAVQHLPPHASQRADLLRVACFEGDAQSDQDVDDLKEACNKLPAESWSPEDARRAAGAMCGRSGGTEVCEAFEQRSLERSLEIDRQACDAGKDAGACADLPRKQEQLWCFKHIVFGAGGKDAERACAGLHQLDPAVLRHIYQLKCNELSDAPSKPAKADTLSKPGKGAPTRKPSGGSAAAAACAELKGLGG